MMEPTSRNGAETMAKSALRIVATLALTATWLVDAPDAAAQHRTSGDARDVSGMVRELTSMTDIVRRAVDRRSDEVRKVEIARWLTAADLLILSGYRRDPHLRMRLAEALVEPEPILEQVVLDGLTIVPVTTEEDPAEDLERAIRLLQEERRHHEPVDWSSHVGLRRDLVFARRVRDALGAQDSAARLATLANDPCERGRCQGIYRSFGEVDRRSIAAVVEARAAIRRIDQAELAGPFWDFVGEELTQDRTALDDVILRPHARLDDLPLVSIDASGPETRPSLILIVTPEGFRYSWVPLGVRITDAGPRAVVYGEPVLPETREVRFPSELNPVPRAIESAAPILAELSAHLPEGAVVALGSQPDVSAHVLSRMFLSLRRAGMSSPALLARGPNGVPRTVPLELVRSRDELPSDALWVHVRLGGYTIRRRGAGRTDIPRVRDARSDEWRFDIAGLRGATEDGSRRKALSSMANVRTGELVNAAFTLSSGASPLTLALF